MSGMGDGSYEAVPSQLAAVEADRPSSRSESCLSSYERAAVWISLGLLVGRAVATAGKSPASIHVMPDKLLHDLPGLDEIGRFAA